MSVFEVVEVTLNSELNVAAGDDLTAQNRVAVVADAVDMVSGCHAGDVDFRCALPKLDDTVRLHSSPGYRPPAPEAVLPTTQHKEITT